jgi:hypothetical protein
MSGEDSLNKTEWFQTNQKIDEPDITPNKSEEELKKNSKPTREYVEENGFFPREMLPAMQLFDKKIANLKAANDIPTTNEDGSEVHFLSSENYEKAHQLFNKKGEPDNNTSSATYLVEADKILVRDDGNYPNYLTASSIFHERIHREIDLKARVYTQKDGQIHSELSRGGLNVVRHAMTGKNKEYGALINELGNFGVQKEIIKDLLEMPEYVDEANARKQRLEKLGVSDKTESITVPFSELGTVVFDIQNVHFDSGGNLQIDFGPFIMMQLVDDMKRLCPEVSGIPLEDAIIRAKAHPEFQNQIRESLDNALGKGFYSKLKNAAYDAGDALHILYEVQQKTRR